MPKRQKIPKDAPVFAEGTKIVGHLNYPPYEAGDDARLAEQHRRFQIFPMGEIRRKGARHIPYNSDKKDFLEKTGREAFESMLTITSHMDVTDLVDSVPVHLSCARRRQRVYRGMGLQRRSGAHDTILQVSKALKGQ